MTEHISTSRLERFRVRALPVTELTSIAKHLDACPPCHQRFVETLQSRRGSEPLKITLAPEFQLRHEHVDYDQLVELADKTMDVSEREMLEVHLKACASCREDVRSFLAFREQLEREAEPSPSITALKPTREKAASILWWRGLAWKPAYAAALLVIGITLVIGVTLLLKRRADLQAKQNQPGKLAPFVQTPTPENHAAVNPTPTAPSIPIPKSAPSPALAVNSPTPSRKAENVPAVVALNDGQRTVSLNDAGDVSGLENIPTETRRDVAETLVAQNIEQPEIAKELAPTSITLRGPSSGQPFKLLTPGRTVIAIDRPTFEWEKLAGATAYRVEVGDMRGHQVAKSEDLSPDRIKWILPNPLKRDETYVWNVIAIVNGKEIVSPGASASEMKFHILSASSVHELEQLKKAGSHLGLGVFYVRQGMTAEAEQEFQVLVRENPQSSLLRKFLKQIQLWRKSEAIR
jgi:hypothetical protein